MRRDSGDSLSGQSCASAAAIQPERQKTLSIYISPYIYEGSVYQRDAVITGTDYPFEFGDLDRLNLKDRVLFTDVDGNVFEYTIQRFFYFTNEQESLLQEEAEKADLILVFPLSRPDQYSGAGCRLVNETDISQLDNEESE